MLQEARATLGQLQGAEGKLHVVVTEMETAMRDMRSMQGKAAQRLAAELREQEQKLLNEIF